MPDLIAFHGNSALKKQCVERLEKYRDARWINPFLPVAWMPEHSMCTPMGALLESADLENFESVTGIPNRLAMLYQTLVGICVVSIPNTAFKEALHSAPPVLVLPDSVEKHWTAWLDVIEVGGKVPDLSTRALTWILRDLLSADHPVAPLPSSVRAQIASVAQLLEAEVEGQGVTAQQWTTARKSCVEMTDAASAVGGHAVFVRPIMEFLESVCWPWAGDYTEPLQSLRSLGHNLTEMLTDQLLSPDDQQIVAGQRQAMTEYVSEAQKNPKFDAQAFFKQSKAFNAFWEFEFQAAQSNQRLKITPLIGGRMLAGLVECIKQFQIA